MTATVEVMVCVRVVLLVVGAFVAEPIFTAEQLSDPVPEILHAAFAFDCLLRVTAPVTVSCAPALTVNEAATPVNVMLAQVAFAVTVTSILFSIKTSLVEEGTEAPGAPPEEADQVDVEFQLPSATAYLVWAFTDNNERNKTAVRNTVLMMPSFLFIYISIFDAEGVLTRASIKNKLCLGIFFRSHIRRR
jgi:hypothetical protein